MDGYLRGQIARLAQINSETLRYYENNNLIPKPSRSKSGYRLYSQAVLDRLEFIKNAKAAGFTLKEIRELFAIAESQTVQITDIIQAVDEKIREIDARLYSLQEMKAALLTFKNQDQASAVHCPHIQAFFNNFND